MKEIQTNKGVLKYRTPNLGECFDILDCLTDDEGKTLKPIQSKKKLIELVIPCLDHESVGYSSKQEMINDPENMLLPISQIADEFYSLAVSAFSKKKD